MKPERPAPVLPKDAQQVISDFAASVTEVRYAPLIRANDVIRLGWALRHRKSKIHDILRDSRVAIDGDDEENQLQLFISFLEDALRAMAVRTREKDILKHKDEPTAPQWPRVEEAQKAALTLQTALAALNADEREYFYGALEFSAPARQPPRMSKRNEGPIAWGDHEEARAFETVLAAVAPPSPKSGGRRGRLPGLAAVFVEEAALYWQSPPLNRRITGGERNGSLARFCTQVSKSFELGLSYDDIVTAVKELARRQRCSNNI